MFFIYYSLDRKRLIMISIFFRKIIDIYLILPKFDEFLELPSYFSIF